MTFSIVEKFERVTFRYQTSKPRTRVYEYHCQWCHYLQQLVGRGSDKFPPSFFLHYKYPASRIPRGKFLWTT